MISSDAAPPPAAARHEAPRVRRLRIGAWTLTIRPDDFTGQVRCDLRAHRMTYAGSAIVFQFPHRWNTYQAVYRLDDGAATPWQVNAMALAASGVGLSNENLADPSDGRVAIPVQTLSGAGAVSIRPSDRRAPASFDLRDLGPALKTAGAAGCGLPPTGGHDR